MLVTTVSKQNALTNRVYFNKIDVQKFNGIYVKIRSETTEYIFLFDIDNEIRPGYIGLSDIHRRILYVPLNQNVTCDNYVIEYEKMYAIKIMSTINYHAKKSIVCKIDESEIQKYIIGIVNGQILSKGQIFVISLNNTLFKVTIDEINILSIKNTEQYDISNIGIVTSKTIFSINGDKDSMIKITGSSQQKSSIFKVPNLDPLILGIGGLNDEFINIVRRTLFSRIFPQEIVKKLGISHVKGILLYGPPGTGKTLMARTISRMLNCRDPKIVSGPELFNKYVGETEANIRKLFSDAEKEFLENGDDSELHIIVIDEIESLCGKRGSHSDGTHVGDNAVDQLLAKIDGVNSLNNVLIIGMTNRKDMIDEAILRPGRIELHIEVGLPDEEGRLQILKIHTDKMYKSNCLADDVILDDLAKKTKNYTGAEIAGIVKNACSFAMLEKFDFRDFHSCDNIGDIQIKQCHFERAIQESVPVFGIDDDDIHKYIPKKIVKYNDDYELVQNELLMCFKQLIHSQFQNTLSVLVHGPLGCGKTSMVVNMSLQSNIPYIKIINNSYLLHHTTEQQKITQIISAFENAYRSRESIIILDDIESLLEYVQIGPRFSNTILQVLKTLIKNTTNKNKLIIIGTCRSLDIIKDLGIYDQFDVKLEMTNITKLDMIKEIIHILSSGRISIEMFQIFNDFKIGQEFSIKEIQLLVDRKLQESMSN